MIGRLTGTIADRNPPQVLLDVGGVGYEVDVPMSTLYDLPENGQRVTLLTHMVVREDAQLLYGFLTASERDAFRALIRITGVGPRIALAVLSGMSADELAQAVARQETGRLQKVPGIGKKTAERLLLELKGKLAEAIGGQAGRPSDDAADVVNALMALGYSDREATAAAKQVPPGTPVSEGIRIALKGLSKV